MDVSAQLTQLQAAIACTSGDERAELQKLYNELSQLTGVTAAPTPAPDPVDEEMRLFQEEMASLGASTSSSSNGGSQTASFLTNDELSDELKALIGTKCQAPFSQEWGMSSYYNAIIFDVETSGEISDLSQIQVRVLFSNPTSQNMKPCSFFMNNRCKFDEDSCKFSHGYLVDLQKIREFVAPDFSKIRRDSKCLALGDDELWHMAVVENVSENRTCTMKFTSKGQFKEVPIEHLLPLEDDDESSDSEEDNSKENCNGNLEEEDTDDFVPVLAWGGVKEVGASFAEWEKYTKGIGSKLMAKMGYEVGKGLGKYGEGRVEPVDTMVYPQGKSLDYCMELREKGGGKKYSVENKLKRQQNIICKQNEKLQAKEHTSVFDFINKKLAPSKGKPSRKMVNEECLKTMDSKALNVELYKVGQDIKVANKELAKLQGGAARFSGSISGHLNSKVKSKQEELRTLQKSQHCIMREQKRRKDHKDMTEF